MTQDKYLDVDRRISSDGDLDYSEPVKEIAKHTNLNITLEGWPAAVTCSVGIGGVVAIIIVSIVKR